MPPSVSPTSCRGKFFTAISIIVDGLAVLISIADVVSDVIVAAQFYQSGEMTWFGLVMGSLALSWIAYTICVISYPKCLRRMELHYKHIVFFPLRWLLVLLVSPFLPLIVWGLCKYADHVESFGDDPRKRNIKEATVAQFDWNVPESALRGGNAASTYLAGLSPNFEEDPVRRFSTSAFDHSRSHMLFYVETVVEALPQSIIQLLAISLLGTYSDVQVLSVVLSIVSIGSKAYIVSMSLRLETMVFRIALVIFDLFSSFYVFSVLLVQSDGGATAGGEAPMLIAGLHLSWPGFLWLINVIIVAVTGSVASCAFSFHDLWLLLHKPDRTSLDLWKVVGSSLAGVLFSPVLLLFLLCAKISFLSMLIHSSGEPHHVLYYPPWRLMTNFILDSQSEAILRRRIAFTTRWGLRHFYRNVAANPWCYRAEQKAAVEAALGVEYSDASEAAGVPLHPTWNAGAGLAPSPELMTKLLKAEVNCQGYELKRASFQTPTWLLVLGGVCLGLYVAGMVAFNLSFPFVNAAMNFDRHRILDDVMFFGMIASLLVVVILLPRQVRLTRVGMLLRPGMRMIQPMRVSATMKEATDLITEYFALTPALCLPSLVPVNVLPAEVAMAVLAPYLEVQGDIDLTDCTPMRAEELMNGPYAGREMEVQDAPAVVSEVSRPSHPESGWMLGVMPFAGDSELPRLNSSEPLIRDA